MTQKQIEAIKQYRTRMTQARLALRRVDVELNKDDYIKAHENYTIALNNYRQFVRSCKGVK